MPGSQGSDAPAESRGKFASLPVGIPRPLGLQHRDSDAEPGSRVPGRGLVGFPGLPGGSAAFPTSLHSPVGSSPARSGTARHCKAPTRIPGAPGVPETETRRHQAILLPATSGSEAATIRPSLQVAGQAGCSCDPSSSESVARQCPAPIIEISFSWSPWPNSRPIQANRPSAGGGHFVCRGSAVTDGPASASLKLLPGRGSSFHSHCSAGGAAAVRLGGGGACYRSEYGEGAASIEKNPSEQVIEAGG